jgi:hypothetical protein
LGSEDLCIPTDIAKIGGHRFVQAYYKTNMTPAVGPLVMAKESFKLRIRNGQRTLC